MSIRTIALCSLLSFLLLFTGRPAHAQSGLPDPTFNPLDTAAYLYSGVNAIAYQADGRILVGSQYSNYDRHGTFNRYLQNGSFDSSFKTGKGFNVSIFALAVQPDGRIIVGGDFTEYDGMPCERLVRLLPDGTFDQTFHVPAGILNSVTKVILLANGDMFVRDKNGLFRLHSDGSHDTTFYTDYKPDVYTQMHIALQTDGKVLVTTSGDQRLIRLHTNGDYDYTFNPATVYSRGIIGIATLSDDRIILTGTADYMEALGIKGAIRLYTTGKQDTSFQAPELDYLQMTSMVVQPDGKLILGGFFDQVFIRLNENGSLDTSYQTGIVPPTPGGFFDENAPRVFCLQADTQLLVGSYSYNTDQYARYNLLRLKTDGALDDGFRIGSSVSGTVNAAVVQPDNKIVLVGNFDSYYGIARQNIVRLNEDGTLDSNFKPKLGYGATLLALQADGKIIVAGELTSCNEHYCGNIARLNPDGSTDSTFQTGIGFESPDPTSHSPFLNCVLVEKSGKILVTGWIASYNGVACHRIARLNANGTIDTSFKLSITNWNGKFIQQQDGKIVISSIDWELDGQTGKGFIRLDTVGKWDRSFHFETELDTWVNMLAKQPDGKIIVELSNSSGHKTIRLLDDGSVDRTFREPAFINLRTLPGSVFAVQPDGKLLYWTDSTIERLDRDGNEDGGFAGSSRFPLDTRNAVFQNDGKILLYGEPAVWNSTMQIPQNTPVKNGLYRLQNCMVTINQRMPVAGMVGMQYASNIYWSKPDSSIKIILAQGALPPGLNLNTQTGEITGTPLAGGLYTFTLNASNGRCSDTYSYQLAINSTEETSTQAGIVVYPIPTEDFLNIHFGKSERGSYEIALFDAGGKLVLRDNVSIDNNYTTAKYDLRQLAAGVYCLRVMKGEEEKVFKVERL